MATVIERAERPRRDDRPAPTKDLSGRYRVIHGDLIVPLSDKERLEAVAAGRPPFESLFVGSIVQLDHDDADRMLEHGVIEPEEPPRRAPVPGKVKRAS
jgi:hypothetical protein